MKGLEQVAAIAPHTSLEIVGRALAAFVLSAIVAHRPWRRLWRAPPPAVQSAHAQVLIAVAGALMIWIVGDSVARAFGLVGLGGFVRFRTGLKDPREAAVLFLMIALGMACGAGAWHTAILAAAIVACVLAVLDFAGRPRGAPLPGVEGVEGAP